MSGRRQREVKRQKAQPRTGVPVLSLPTKGNDTMSTATQTAPVQQIPPQAPQQPQQQAMPLPSAEPQAAPTVQVPPAGATTEQLLVQLLQIGQESTKRLDDLELHIVALTSRQKGVEAELVEARQNSNAGYKRLSTEARVLNMKLAAMEAAAKLGHIRDRRQARDEVRLAEDFETVMQTDITNTPDEDLKKAEARGERVVNTMVAEAERLAKEVGMAGRKDQLLIRFAQSTAAKITTAGVVGGTGGWLLALAGSITGGTVIAMIVGGIVLGIATERLINWLVPTPE